MIKNRNNYGRCLTECFSKVVLDDHSSFRIFFLTLFILLSAYPSSAIEIAITSANFPTSGPIPVKSSASISVEKMLAALKKHNIQNVYGFLNGVELENEPERIKILEDWIKGGQRLGNNSYANIDFSKTTIESFKKNISLNDPILAKVSEDANYKYFRYPYLQDGDTYKKRMAIREYLKKEGYKIVPVTIDMQSWAWSEAYARCVDKPDPEAMQWLKESYLKTAVASLLYAQKSAQVLFDRDIKHILILNTSDVDAEMLDALIGEYKKHGVKFIELQEALDDPVYAVDPNLPYSTSGNNFLERYMQRKKVRAGPPPSIPFGELNDKCLGNG